MNSFFDGNPAACNLALVAPAHLIFIPILLAFEEAAGRSVSWFHFSCWTVCFVLATQPQIPPLPDRLPQDNHCNQNSFFCREHLSFHDFCPDFRFFGLFPEPCYHESRSRHYRRSPQPTLASSSPQWPQAYPIRRSRRQTSSHPIKPTSIDENADVSYL